MRVSRVLQARLFTKWVGISPKQYSQFLLKERALIELGKKQPLLSTSLALGLSSSSRFHDLMVKTVAMTPSEVQQMGAGVKILYAFVETPFGQALLAWSSKGIVNLTFTEEKENELNELKKNWYHESPRVLRRLQTLRRLSHEQEIKSFFTGDARTRCSDGAGASR